MPVIELGIRLDHRTWIIEHGSSSIDQQTIQLNAMTVGAMPTPQNAFPKIASLIATFVHQVNYALGNQPN